MAFELSRQTGLRRKPKGKKEHEFDELYGKADSNVGLYFLNTNFASKREQCQTCLSIAEREQSQDRDSGIN